MEIKEIIELMQAVSENGLTSFKIEEGNLKLSIKKESLPGPSPLMAGVLQAPNAPQPGAMPAPNAGQFEVLPAQNPAQPGGAPMKAAAPSGALPEGAEGAGQAVESDKVIASPLVGTFYNSPSPDAEAFVKPGDAVKKGQTLGIIEAMKLMNEIESEYDGVIEAVLVGNEQVVEYGQPLFRIR